MTIIHCTFANPCAQDWATMAPGRNDGERHCATCNTRVCAVTRRYELEAHAKAGHHVAAALGMVTLLDEQHPFVDPHRPIGILGAPDDVGEVRTALTSTRKTRGQ
jgi:hypothetical protein